MVGGFTTAMEELDMQEIQWNHIGNIPDILHGFTSLIFNEDFYVFGLLQYFAYVFLSILLGGYSQLARDYVDRVWKFDGIWTVVGHMKEKRINFRTVLVQDFAYTAGGLGTVSNEVWSFSDNTSKRLSTSITYKIFPELIPVKYLNCDSII